jgi:Tol biopolymer transport system component
VAAAALGAGFLARAPRPERVVRFELAAPAALLVVGEPKLSPDGNHVAFVGVDEKSEAKIWVRSLDTLAARPLAGTEGTSSRVRPFWSPDSRHLAFMAEGKLKKVPLDGGPAQKICDAPSGADGTWSEEGTILFDGQPTDPILAVDAAGGVAKPIVSRVEGEDGYQVAWPQWLPGGKRFLYVTFDGKEEQNGIRVAERDGSGGKLVVGGLSRVEYAPPGYLVFVRETTLVAQRFDVDSGRLSGEPIPIADGIGVDANGQAEFSVSRTGVLVYRAGAASASEYVWLDRKGNRLESALAEGELGAFDLSPDGRWLAYQVGTGTEADLWVRDLRRGVSSRFTFEKTGELAPLFSRDGSKILFTRIGGGEPARIVARALDRTGADETLFAAGELADRLAVNVLAPGGKTLYLQQRLGGGEWEIRRLALGAGAKPEPVVGSEATNVQAVLSPDGRWLAFTSFESEPPEVYVVGVAGAAGRWQVSTKGGAEPAWGPDGRELFYLSLENRLMRVAVSTGSAFDAGVPEPLFPVALSPIVVRNRYRLAPDGERFLAVVPAGRGGSAPMTAVLGWDAALAK